MRQKNSQKIRFFQKLGDTGMIENKIVSFVTDKDSSRINSQVYKST